MIVKGGSKKILFDGNDLTGTENGDKFIKSLENEKYPGNIIADDNYPPEYKRIIKTDNTDNKLSLWELRVPYNKDGKKIRVLFNNKEITEEEVRLQAISMIMCPSFCPGTKIVI